MANYFAVGTGNWSGASTVWATSSGGIPGTVTPTSADTCTFDANTLVHTVTVTGTSGSPDNCGNLVMTAPSGTLVMGSTAVLNVAGSLTGAAGMTFVPSSTSLIKFTSTTTGNTITFAGYAFGPLTFDGVGGGWTFQDTNSMVANITLTLTNGSLDTGSKAQTNGILFSSNNSNTRSLTLGTTNFKLSPNGGTVWNIGTSTGMTLSAASSTITLQNTTSTQTFASGGLTYGTLTGTLLTTGTFTLTGSATFGTLTESIASGTPTITSGYVFPAGATTTVTGTFTATGSALTTRNFLSSSTSGTAATISAGTFAITNTDLRDITKAGAGSGNISATSSTTGNGDCGGNAGWTFQGTRNVYKKSSVSNNWSSGATWFTTSGGSTAAVPPLPLCHDTAIFDVNSITAGSKTVTVDTPRIAGFNWTGVANTPAFAIGSTPFEIYGSWITASGMTNTGTANIHFAGRGSNTINAVIAPPANNMTFDAGTGTYTLAANFSNAGGAWAHSSGTLNFGGFTLTAAAAPTLTSGSWVGPGNYNAFVIPAAGGSGGGTPVLQSAIIQGLGAI